MNAFKLRQRIQRRFQFTEDELKVLCPDDDKLEAFAENLILAQKTETEQWDSESKVEPPAELIREVEIIRAELKAERLRLAQEQIAEDKAMYEGSQAGLAPEAKTKYSDYLSTMKSLGEEINGIE